MNKTGVKICGLQSVEVLKSMVNLPVDYIGFVFADSKRRIDGVQAGELLRVLDEWTSGSRPRSVGVFVNPGDALLNDVMEKAPLMSYSCMDRRVQSAVGKSGSILVYRYSRHGLWTVKDRENARRTN